MPRRLERRAPISRVYRGGWCCVYARVAVEFTRDFGCLLEAEYLKKTNKFNVLQSKFN